jgi:hypothetical protein
VTRRILTPEPGITTVAAPLYYEQAPLTVDALTPDYVEPAQTQTLRTRRAVAPRPSTVGTAERTQTTTRSTTHSAKPSVPPARTAVRTVVRTVYAPPPRTAYAPSDLPLVLSPGQRQLVYRSIVQRDLYPAPAVAPWPPVVAQTEFAAPANYPLQTIYPADNGYGYADYGYRGYPDYGYRRYDDRDYAYRDVYRDDYRAYGYQGDRYRDRYGYRWDGAPLVVGARIPQSVPLIAVPDPVAARIPAARPYSYALLDNRVYLVDPATGIIVAEIAP